MTKLRKQRRRKVFRHNINRKRLRNKLNNVGTIGCGEIKVVWEQSKSIQTNLKEMGLSYDPNVTIKIPNSKKELTASIVSNKNDWLEEKVTERPSKDKTYVAEALEEDAKAPRERLFRLPKSQVEWLTYLMKKHGKNYRAMSMDHKNYNQETWKQLRAKINRFKRIPEQYNKYLEKNGLDPNSSDDNESDDEI